MSHLNKYLYLLIVVFCFIQDEVQAKGAVKNLNPLNWSGITELQYLENQVACQLKIQEFKWSKSLWPKENT
jgi:hypothetical protein